MQIIASPPSSPPSSIVIITTVRCAFLLQCCIDVLLFLLLLAVNFCNSLHNIIHQQYHPSPYTTIVSICKYGQSNLNQAYAIPRAQYTDVSMSGKNGSMDGPNTTEWMTAQYSSTKQSPPRYSHSQGPRSGRGRTWCSAEPALFTNFEDLSIVLVFRWAQLLCQFRRRTVAAAKWRAMRATYHHHPSRNGNEFGLG